MKRVSLFLGLLLLSACSSSENSRESFVEHLMHQMTLQEKIGQLNLPTAGDIVTGLRENSDLALKIRKGQIGGLFNIQGVEKIAAVQKMAVEESRLGIPLLFGMDVIHGYKTVFPIPLGLAATWNEALVEQSARIAANEASADGLNWTFSPMVDICRDPRWGRMAEGFGEDVHLASRLAAAMVRGYQGNNLAADSTVMACVKHFALYGASESGRDYNTVDMSRVRMYNEYLPPYRAAIDAGCRSIMSAFNEVDGIPASANRWLLTDLLRKEWGFDGFVVSDFTSINEMMQHGLGDLSTVSAAAINAGLDLDMAGEGYLTKLESLIKEGRVREKSVDEACRRILLAKYDLGLFEDPYRYCKHTQDVSSKLYTKAYRAQACRTAAESFVLLKNADQVLPLKAEGTIAVVGPLANEGANMAGTWSVVADLQNIAPLVEGVRRAAPRAHILVAQGSNLCYNATLQENSTLFGRTMHRDSRDPKHITDEAVALAHQADVVIVAMGEASEMSGESSCRADISLPDAQQDLLKALVATGKPIVGVLFTGRAMTLGWEDENLSALLNVWFAGTESADAIAEVLFGKINPSGKLPVTFPRSVGQIPIYYNSKNTGRPLEPGKWFSKFRSNYLDVDNKPLYPFGYGLSYTTFRYGPIELSNTTVTTTQSLEASVVVTNTGSCDGAEVVQMYLRDVVGSNTRPMKELKAFEKLYLKAGESRTVTFVVTPQMRSFYNDQLQFITEVGEFVVMIGTDSEHLDAATFTQNI